LAEGHNTFAYEKKNFFFARSIFDVYINYEVQVLIFIIFAWCISDTNRRIGFDDL